MGWCYNLRNVVLFLWNLCILSIVRSDVLTLNVSYFSKLTLVFCQLSQLAITPGIYYAEIFSNNLRKNYFVCCNF